MEFVGGGASIPINTTVAGIVYPYVILWDHIGEAIYQLSTMTIFIAAPGGMIVETYWDDAN